MQPSRISELATVIANQTAIVDDYLTSHKLPTLSFDPDGPSKVPIPPEETEVISAQDKVLASTQELHDLMKGPTELLMGLGAISPNDTLSLQAAYHYNIASLIPLDSVSSYSEISRACGLNEIDLYRLMRHAMTNHVFQERDGKIAHTAASKILKENGMMRDIVGILCEEMFPGTSRTIDALKKWNGAKAPNQSGFTLGHHTDGGLYDVLGQHPERGRRFAGAMSGFAERTGIDTLAQAFDWAAVTTVVDVGGGRGEVSIGLAERFAHLHFMVQDLKRLVEEAPDHEKGNVAKRIEYANHNYFHEQCAVGKDVYYFRYVFHNLPDDSCVELLRAQIPALKPGAHILIQDAVIPEPRNELPAYKEKYRRSMDLVMLTLFGARERTLEEWKAMIARADRRFEVRCEFDPSGASSDLLDVVWTESSNLQASLSRAPASVTETPASTQPSEAIESSASTEPFSIAIVGGGLGGLCLAVALAKHNVNFHLYEATLSFSEIGAGVGLGPNAMRAMELLDPAIAEAYARCLTTSFESPEEQKRFFNFRYGMKEANKNGTKAGDLICEVRSKTLTSGVHRASFVNELVKCLPQGVTSMGKRLQDIVEEGDGVVLKFADGTEARQNAVVGCDGIKSQVRKILLGEQDEASKPVFSGKYCYRGLTTPEKAIEVYGEKGLALESQMYLGRGGHVLTTVIAHGTLVNVVAYTTKDDKTWNDDEWVKPTTKEEMLAHFEGWSESVKDILELIEKLDVWALFDHPPAATYHRKGTICLLGDAAHATTPHMGAGAGMAVEDALVLAKLLASIDGRGKLESVFAAYDRVRRPRSQKLVAESRKMGEIYDFQDEVVGDDLDKMREHLEHGWEWVWDEDLERQIADAQAVQREWKGRD